VGAPEVEAEQPAAGVLSEAAVRGWLVEQVGRWLRGEVEVAAAPSLADPPALVALFAEHEIDGDALLELWEEDLHDALGIATFGHRNHILKPIAALRRPAAASASRRTRGELTANLQEEEAPAARCSRERDDLEGG
jgi:hypothetical protein